MSFKDFNIGDKVEILDTNRYGGQTVGMHGEIIFINPNWDLHIKVKVPGAYNPRTCSDSFYFNDSELKKLKRGDKQIEKVIFNDPATIIIWNDGSKTIVKCMEDEEYDAEKGLAMALCKKYLGDNFRKTFKKYLKEYEEKEEKLSTNPEFKVGDRVRVLTNPPGLFTSNIINTIGKIGVVKNVNDVSVHVEFDDGNEWWYYNDQHLELVQENKEVEPKVDIYRNISVEHAYAYDCGQCAYMRETISNGIHCKNCYFKPDHPHYVPRDCMHCKSRTLSSNSRRCAGCYGTKTHPNFTPRNEK